MATRKNTKKKIKSNINYNSLYVNYNEPKEKRRILLNTIKDSLVLQKEYEIISNIRGNKYELIKKIKSNLNEIKNKYSEMKKILPNVKNVFSHIENEVKFINKEIETLKKSEKFEEEKVKNLIKVKKKMIGTRRLDIKKSEHSKVTSKKSKDEKLNVSSKKNAKLSKLDRIKHNIEVIENKLKTLK